jgi:predicted RNA binding protein YcfA (HicA-like mRNA interferase family)
MIPKDLTDKELIKMLKIFGYVVIRQSGNHIRIQTEKKWQTL